MSDIGEPKSLSAARFSERISELELSLVRAKRRKLEIAHELSKLEENEGATIKAIAEFLV